MDVKKVVIIGGESTGKSTLCESLASHYNTVWVEEYAREYLEQLNRPYIESDLIDIANGQVQLEDSKLRYANRFLFCDTDLHVIKVWSEFKYGQVDAQIQALLQSRTYDAYIITSPDFDWVDDPLREHPEPELRLYFFERYKQLVEETNLSFCIVHGDGATRMKTSIEFLSEL